MIETAFRALMAGNAAVAALVESSGTVRIYPKVLPQAPTYPAATYMIATGEAHYQMQGPSNLERVRMQVDLYAENFATLLAFKKAVMQAVSGFRGEVGSPPVQIYGVFKNMEIDDFESGLDESAGPKVWRKTLDFNIWFKETYT